MGIKPTCAARIRRLYFEKRMGIAPIAALTGYSLYAVEKLVKAKGWNVARAAIKDSARGSVSDDDSHDALPEVPAPMPIRLVPAQSCAT